MPHFCAKCGTDVTTEVNRGKVARGDSCPKCKRDLHSCLNCKHYDAAAYNNCKEPQAERQVDKEKANFCDYFSYGERSQISLSKANNALKALDDLFKK